MSSEKEDDFDFDDNKEIYGDRLAPRPNVKRIPSHVYGETRGVLHTFLDTVLQDVVIETSENGNRRTVTAMDIVMALRRQGKQLHCFQDTTASPSEALSHSEEEYQEEQPTPILSANESDTPHSVDWKLALTHFTELQSNQLLALFEVRDHQILAALDSFEVSHDLRDLIETLSLILSHSTDH